MKRIKYSMLVSLVLLAVVCVGPASAWRGPQYDFDGQTVTIYHWRADNEAYMNFDDGPGRAHLEWVEETFNVKINLERPGDGGNFIDTLQTYVLTGEPEPAIFVGQNQWMYSAAVNGYLLELDNILDEAYYDSLPPITRNLAQGHTFLNKTVGFAEALVAPIEVQGVIWNKTKFEDQGFRNLYELNEAGEWTWDALAVGVPVLSRRRGTYL